jgi:hypothetical protein
MNHVRQEIATYTRACERLLSQEGKLSDDERSLVEFYVKELSGAFLSAKPAAQVRYNETVASQTNLGSVNQG